MPSATSIERHIRALDADAVRDELARAPHLLDHRDGRGRTWLHLVCSLDRRGRPDDGGADVAIADDLLGRGLDIDDAAFTENAGRWRATPLWFAVARGRNLVLARHLLERGCDPNHSLWAAEKSSPTPQLVTLAELGPDVDIPGPDGRTARDRLAHRRDPVLRELAARADQARAAHQSRRRRSASSSPSGPSSRRSSRR